MSAETKKTSLVLPLELHGRLRLAVTARGTTPGGGHRRGAGGVPGRPGGQQVLPTPVDAFCAWDDAEPATRWTLDGGVLLPARGDPDHEGDGSCR